MSSFLQGIGLGVCGAMFQQQQPYPFSQEAMQQSEARHRYIVRQVEHRCIHQDCPICAEETKKAYEKLQETTKRIRKEELAYRKRCIEWVDKIHKLVDYKEEIDG